jgi:flavin-dependent dehydrogenase
MEKRYDVIIIGAGPAGLKCAEQLMDSDRSVLLIEKNEIIGPKICAGGLTNLTTSFNIPEDKTRSFSRQKIFMANRQYEINLVNPLKTISRFDLGQFQLSKLKDANNIKILRGTLVKSIKKNEVITNKGAFYFRYLVGADGSTSKVRKYIGLASRICIGLYYDVPEVTHEFIWYFDPELLKFGYIWVFPHKDFTNIGVYFNPADLSPRRAREILKEYLTENGYRFTERNFKGAPINHFYRGCIFDHIFLVGDAAGLASKTTGEGISYALTSGKEIGKKIIDPDYQMVELDEILKFKNRQEKMLKTFDMLPYWQDYLFKIFIRLMKKCRFQRYFGN